MKLANDTLLLQGNLLVADPFLQEQPFRRSVVFLAEYTPEGAVGFVLNQPTPFAFNDIVEGFPDFPAPVYLGGPVENQILHFLHTIPNLKGSYHVADGIYWGGNLTMLKSLMQQQVLQPSDIRFFIGYSGWGPQQLDSEIAQKNWIVAPTAPSAIFGPTPSSLWAQLLQSLGHDYALLVHAPSHPSLN